MEVNSSRNGDYFRAIQGFRKESWHPVVKILPIARGTLESGDGAVPHAEEMAMMLDCGWSPKQIVTHFGVSVYEVILLIREHVRQERDESSSQVADWTSLPMR